MADLAVETVDTVLPAQADDQLKSLIDDFLMDLEISRRSQHTIKNYRSDLGRFQKFIVEQGRPLDIVLIRSYLGSLQNVAPATRARHHSALKTFFEWCYRQDSDPRQPHGQVPPAKSYTRAAAADPQERPGTVDAGDSEVKTAGTSCSSPCWSKPGLRINEALGIYVEDIVLSAGQEGIRFRGKGEYEREIPLPFEFESLKLLRAYLRNEDLTAGPLFRTGKYKDQRMSYQHRVHSINGQSCVNRAEVKCQIHQLRHTAATELVNSGVGVGTVRQLLGHRNLQTTQRYAELSGQTVRHELDAFARRKTRTR